jgi:hypothetical protein
MRTATQATSGAVALLLATLVAAVLGASSAASRPSAPEPSIRSSLDGKKVLPRRIRWIAYPSFLVNYPGVEFLIDGRVVFANRLPPFAFADDGKDEATRSVKTGYLVTSWLSPGKHEFTVRGRGQGADRKASATKTVIARVRPAPPPPAQLAGVWQREVTTAVPPDRNALYHGFTAPAGTYRIAVDRRFVEITGPDGRHHVRSDYVAGAATITIAGPVWTGEQNETAWCEPWGPEATYSWSVGDGTLTLAPLGTDACKQRGAILAGDWTRVG